MEQNEVIQSLYYKYKKTRDEDIIDWLQHNRIVKLEHKGPGTIYGYYPLSEESIDKIKKNPRGTSLTFDATETSNELLQYKVSKTIPFLVKSSSRFFLKPDIGEIIDAIPCRESYVAICLHSGYVTLDGTQGEHFIMEVDLLVSTEAIKM